MVCAVSVIETPDNGGLTSDFFTAELIVGTGALSYDAVNNRWEVTPKPDSGAATVRFTPVSAYNVTHIVTRNDFSGAYGTCDGVSLEIVFVGGSPATVSLAEGDLYDGDVSGVISYIDVTYQSTVTLYLGKWVIDQGLVEFAYTSGGGGGDCCILEKTTNITHIPGDPGQAGFPGVPAKPAYCATVNVQTCEWVFNPAITIKNDCYLAWGWWPIDPNVSAGCTTWWLPPSQNCLPYVAYKQGQVCQLNMYYNGQYIAPFSSLGNIGAASSINGVQLYVWKCYNKPITTCYPATAAIAPIPYIAPTPAQVITNYNLGWNTHSRAIAPLDVGDSLIFTVANGVHGVFVGLGPSGVDGQNLALFGWGLMIDTTGVKVFENGVQVDTLAVSYDSSTAFSIEREYDGRLIYRADLDSYTSASPPAGIAVLYPYTYLYSGGDRLLCASYVALDPEQTSDATMVGIGTLLVGAPSVDGTFNAAITLVGTGDLTVDEPYPYAITLTGEASLSAGITSILSNLTLPALEMIGADFAYSFVDTALPELELVSSMAMYVPQQPTTMYATLPFLQAYGFIQTVEIDNGDMILPEMQVVGGDYEYAFFNQSFPPLQVFGMEGNRLEMEIMSHLVTFFDFQSVASGVLVLMSHGQLQSVQTFQVAVLMDMISQMVAASQWTVLGEFGLSLMSGLQAQSSQLLTGVTGAAVNDTARVWVVNMDNGASSQYDNYGFNSYFNRDGLAYGVADDGIYLLQGELDAGSPIEAAMDMGTTSFDAPVQKRLPAVYATVAGDKLILKVEVDGSDPYYYEMRSSSEHLDKHRFDPGRGLVGVEWSFSLLNQNGEDFELSSLEFAPVAMKRRI
jgi:hypothetical protein